MVDKNGNVNIQLRKKESIELLEDLKEETGIDSNAELVRRALRQYERWSPAVNF